ncbi:MAG: hypothetical protein AAFV93_19235 [Chloroflexota bacterium]
MLERLNLSSKPRSFWIAISILAILAVILVIVFYQYAPIGVDWEETYTDAARKWLDPYEDSTFTNPPWALLFLPHAFLDLRLGNAINLVLNFGVLMLVMRKFGGDVWALLLVFTSPFMLDLARTNNIDWLPALALLVPPTWGILLLSVKPQTIGAVALIWWKERNFTPRILVPTLIVTGLSFVIYGFWVTRVAGLPPQAGAWNIAPFPFGIPIGLYLLYIAYRAKDADDGVIFAAIGTAFVTPYIAPYSLNTAMALGASKYRREAFIVWIAAWIFVIYTARRQEVEAMFGG